MYAGTMRDWTAGPPEPVSQREGAREGKRPVKDDKGFQHPCRLFLEITCRWRIPLTPNVKPPGFIFGHQTKTPRGVLYLRVYSPIALIHLPSGTWFLYLWVLWFHFWFFSFYNRHYCPRQNKLWHCRHIKSHREYRKHCTNNNNEGGS
jgi:hypothetical protein